MCYPIVLSLWAVWQFRWFHQRSDDVSRSRLSDPEMTKKGQECCSRGSTSMFKNSTSSVVYWCRYDVAIVEAVIWDESKSEYISRYLYWERWILLYHWIQKRMAARLISLLYFLTIVIPDLETHLNPLDQPVRMTLSGPNFTGSAPIFTRAVFSDSLNHSNSNGIAFIAFYCPQCHVWMVLGYLK